MAWFTKRRITDPDDARMSLGEHLEELRGCVARSLIAVLTACLLCIWPAKYLLELLARPMVLILRRHGQPASFLATSPVESILVYIKVVMIFGLVLAAPYVLHQLWSFVAAGLYANERKWVMRLVPASFGLFLAGVVFMYVLALLVSLNFLVGFSGWLPQPAAEPTALERVLLDIPRPQVPTTQPGVTAGPVVTMLERDPDDPPVGAVWLNVTENKLKVRRPEGTQSVQLTRDDRHALVTTHFKIGEYLTFVLIMTLAFGAAFQMPLVVLFLARSGIVPVAVFRKYRKIVILVIVFVAGLLAPPDLLSHLMLSGPMIVLFELGLWLAARRERQVETERATEETGTDAAG